MSKIKDIFNGYEIPVNDDNEFLILSSAIQNRKNFEMLVKKVNPMEFRVDECKTIAWALKKVHEDNMEVTLDSILLCSKSSPIKKMLDSEYINKLITNYPAARIEDYDKYINRLKTDYIKSSFAEKIFTSLYHACMDPLSDLAAIEARVNDMKEIIRQGYSSSVMEFKSMNQIVEEYKQGYGDKSQFYTTGFRQLDEKLTEGLRPGKITIVAGLAGMGKSSFTLSMMKNLSIKRIPCAQFALEMDRLSLTTKLLAFQSNLSIKNITKDFKKLSEDDQKLYAYELDRLSKNKHIWINDKPTQTLAQIKEQSLIIQDHLYPNGGSGYIVVPIDLFGKIKDFSGSDNFARDYETKLNEAQGMTRELNIHSILVAQINREVSKGKLRRPKMANLKNAGAFEEVADLILAAHRPHYDPEAALKNEIYNLGVGHIEIDDDFDAMETDYEKNLAEIIILKQRMGPGNTLINFYMDPHTTCFRPFDTIDQEYINKSKFDEIVDDE